MVKVYKFVEIVWEYITGIQNMAIYFLVSTEEHPEEEKRIRRFIYQGDDDCWYISRSPGKRNILLKNSKKSSSIPLDGWKFMSNKLKMIRDSSAKIQFGRLPQDDGIVTLDIKLECPAAEKFPKCAGTFWKGSKYYCGRPVYESEGGMILYCSDEGKWCFGDKVGVAFIRSSSAGSWESWDPSEEESWAYWDDTQQTYAAAEIIILFDFY